MVLMVMMVMMVMIVMVMVVMVGRTGLDESNESSKRFLRTIFLHLKKYFSQKYFYIRKKLAWFHEPV